MRPVATPRSTFIFCPAGHLVAITKRDLYYGESSYTDGIGFMENQPIPSRGSIPKCYCGESWWRGDKVSIKYYDWTYVQEDI